MHAAGDVALGFFKTAIPDIIVSTLAPPGMSGLYNMSKGSLRVDFNGTA
jgi:hypothetical protein